MLSHAAMHEGVPSGLFAFEATAQDVLLRVLSADTGIEFRDLRRARMTDADWTDTAQRMVKMADAPLHINAGPAPHLEGLVRRDHRRCCAEEARCRRRRPGRTVLARTFADNREREVADVVRRPKHSPYSSDPDHRHRRAGPPSRLPRLAPQPHRPTRHRRPRSSRRPRHPAAPPRPQRPPPSPRRTGRPHRGQEPPRTTRHRHRAPPALGVPLPLRRPTPLGAGAATPGHRSPTGNNPSDTQR